MAKALVGEVIAPAQELRARAMGPHFYTPDAEGSCLCGSGRENRSHKAGGMTVREMVAWRRMVATEPMDGDTVDFIQRNSR